MLPVGLALTATRPRGAWPDARRALSAGNASALGFGSPLASYKPKLRSRGFGPGGRSHSIHLPAPASPIS